jgi:hypothetical protein
MHVIGHANPAPSRLESWEVLVEITQVVDTDVLLCQNSGTTMHPKICMSSDREENTQVIYNCKPIFYLFLARKYVKECIQLVVETKAWSELKETAYEISLQPCHLSLHPSRFSGRKTNKRRAWTGWYPCWLHSIVIYSRNEPIPPGIEPDDTPVDSTTTS